MPDYDLSIPGLKLVMIELQDLQRQELETFPF